MLRAPGAWRVDGWPQGPGEQSWEPHEGPLVTRQDSGQEFLGTDQGSSSFFTTFVCWPPLYFVQHKTTYLRFCPRSGGGVGAEGIKGTDGVGSQAAQSACTPAMLLLPARPLILLFSSHLLDPVCPSTHLRPRLLVPHIPHSIKCNKLSPSPRGAGSELNSSPSPARTVGFRGDVGEQDRTGELAGMGGGQERTSTFIPPAEVNVCAGRARSSPSHRAGELFHFTAATAK